MSSSRALGKACRKEKNAPSTEIIPLTTVTGRLVALNSPDTLSVQMVDHDLAEAGASSPVDTGSSPKDLSEQVERYLMTYFSSFGRELPPPGLYDRIIRQVEQPLLSAALAATRGNQIRAAELLGLNRNTLRSRIKALDIRVFRTPSP